MERQMPCGLLSVLSGVTLALHQTRASRGHGRAVPALLGTAVLD